MDIDQVRVLTEEWVKEVKAVGFEEDNSEDVPEA